MIINRKFCVIAMLIVIFIGSTAYINKKSFCQSKINITPDVMFSDIDGNSYKTVKIGNKVWMAENFKAQKTAKGQILTGVFSYDNNSGNVTNYGRLYTWPAAVDATPIGWHLPTQEEWDQLINLVGGAGVAGGKLKERGTAHWNNPNTGAENLVGFSAVGGGFRGGDGIYYDLGKHGSYWGSAKNTQDPFCVYIYNTTANAVTEVSPIDKTSGIAFAVRYVRNK